MRNWMKNLGLICVVAVLLLSAGAAAEPPAYYTRGEFVADFTLTTWTEETVTLSDLLAEKDVVLLHIFTLRCGGCEEEMPLLQAAYEAWGERVALLAVTIDDADTDKQLKTYCTRRGLTFPTARDTAGLAYCYPIYGVPTTFVIDRDGVLREIKEGAIKDLAAFEKLITPWLSAAETETPAE